MVRVTGPNATSLGMRIFTPAEKWSGTRPAPYRAFVGRTHPPDNPAESIDHAVFTCFQAPRSYTGEDTVEITTHGGAVILRAVLQAAVDAGARLADPGEFTRRAYMNGRLDLAQAESVASLVSAATDEARKVMLRQLDGAFSTETARIKEALVEAKVLVESAIDFPEDVPETDTGTIRGLLDLSAGLAAELLLTSGVGIALSRGLSVAIAGTPNVGKSSLLNALLQEERAIVHEMPGTTRDFIEGQVDIKGVVLRVLDTAGVRDDAGAVEVKGILRTREILRSADLIVVLLDGSREAGSGDMSLLRETENRKRIIAVNKADLPQAAPAREDGVLRVSAKTGQGLKELKEAIYEKCCGSSLPSGEAVVTSLRQKSALEDTLASCGRAIESLSSSASPELLAVDIDAALLSLGELVGDVTSQEILDRIFSSFCIGK